MKDKGVVGKGENTVRFPHGLSREEKTPGVKPHNVALFSHLEYERNNTGSVRCESFTIPTSPSPSDPSLNPLSLKREYANEDQKLMEITLFVW